MIETDFEAAKEDMAELTASDYEVGEPVEEREIAANFVFRHGALGDFLAEPALSQTQFWVGQIGAAFCYIGHWSVQRNDPLRGEADQTFLDHVGNCEVCAFLENAYTSRTMFEFETCDQCGGDIKAHAIVTVPVGQPGVACLGQWQRLDPAVEDAGNVSFNTQRSDAYMARWSAPLADGSFAVVTRTYFVSFHESRMNLCRIDAYGVAEDPHDPRQVWMEDDWNMVDLDSADPQAENLVQLATDSYAPEPGEWQQYGPDSDNFAVPAAA